MFLGIPGTGGMAGGPELIVLLVLLVMFVFVAGPAFVVGYVLGRRSDD